MLENIPYQINDGLTQTASCGNAVCYDSKRGIVFAEAMTGEQCMYGESSGAINIAVFPPSQPWNVKRVQIDKIGGASRGLLCNAIYLLDDGTLRIIYTKDRGEGIGVYYKDYDLRTDTLTEKKSVLFHTEKGDMFITSDAYAEYLASRGWKSPSKAQAIINKVTRYNGEYYTAITLDGTSYPVLCTIRDNVLYPFAVVPVVNSYEFRYYRDENGLYGVSRYRIDDTGTGKITYMHSADNGATWDETLFEDSIQSRPDILPYYGKPLIIYNYKPDRTNGNFPPMHHHRNAIKFVYDGNVIKDMFSKYGIVEHETISICGDLYMVFSDSTQALMSQNNACWQEDGIQVENGKEKSNWMKIGYIL